ncbi:MAG: beta-ketoacyl synthase N-terminal-like domain-containing protein [Actinocatenispora sp.]
MNDDDAIAIVGMAVRVPGAADVETFWRNLLDEVDSVRTFTDDELRVAGVDAELLADPRYVRTSGHLDGLADFDAEFFGYPPAEAALIDPQQRLFLETAWAAMEDAGHEPSRVDGPVGVFTGTSANRYFLAHLYGNPAVAPRPRAGDPDALMPPGHAPDYLPLRVSYKLGLTGPSVAVQTACASSLVAVCLAAQSLLDYRCDLAIAGGASVAATDPSGYLAREGGLLSPDGVLRAFDADARGTLYGTGAGAIVLKRLADAGDDHVYAVIRGWGVGNDGAQRAGFAAPGVSGLASAVAEAMSCADLDPTDIGYLEAHGSGTPVGDAIEVRALAEAFRGRAGRCLLGSVKTNIGNLDAAAGVVGLVKTALAVQRGLVPASLHFTSAHPDLNLSGGPFEVAAKTSPWPAGSTGRHAGVSSIGLGGTGAHVLLSEPPRSAQPPGSAQPHGAAHPAEPHGAAAPATGEWQLLPLSARTPGALDDLAERLAARLSGPNPPELADVAYTLAVGRRVFGTRTAVLARNLPEAVAGLRGARPGDGAPEHRAAEWRDHGTVADPGAGRRVPLPTYPFQRVRHWIERPGGQA